MALGLPVGLVAKLPGVYAKILWEICGLNLLGIHGKRGTRFVADLWAIMLVCFVGVCTAVFWHVNVYFAGAT